MDVLRFESEKLGVDLARERASQAHVETDGILGWGGGYVKLLRTHLPCARPSSVFEQRSAQARPSIGLADVQEFELELIAAGLPMKRVSRTATPASVSPSNVALSNVAQKYPPRSKQSSKIGV